MASSVDANVGTLLFHLNQMRHPTRMEARLQQISDEYLLLTESLGKQKAPAAKKTGKISLEELLDRLRDELESNLVPLPDAPAFGNSAQFGTELLSKQISAIVKKLNSPDVEKQKKSIRLLDTLTTSDLAVEKFLEAGGAAEFQHLFSNFSSSPIARDIFHITACLSAFAPFRSSAIGETVLETVVDLVNAKARDSNPNLDLVVWILSNYCVEQTRSFRLGQQTLAALIDLMSHSNQSVANQALRSVTSLTVARANRKVVDAWEGFHKIVSLLDAPSSDISLAAMWALGHMASQDCEDLFDQNLSVIRRISRIITTPGISTEQRTIACQCVANFALLSKTRPIVLQEDTVAGLQTIIQELYATQQDVEPEEFALLQEATVALSNLAGKEAAIADSISIKTLQAVVSLLSSPSSTIVSACAWCIAHISRYDKLHHKIELSGGLEAAIKLLWRTQTHSEQLPAAWIAAKMAIKPENQERIRDADGIVPLVKLLFAKEQDVRLAASNALFYLSMSSKNKQLIKSLYTKLSQKDSVMEQRLKAT